MKKDTIVIATLLAAIWTSLLAFGGQKHRTYRTGQIIGISQQRYDPSTYLFELLTGSRFGHVGIVVNGSDIYRLQDRLMQDDDFREFTSITEDTKSLDFVAESRPGFSRSSGVNLTLLQEFMATAVTSSVIEPKDPLSDDQLVTLILFVAKCCKQRIEGTLTYNHLQKMQIVPSPTQMNCSEFVYWTFRSVGIIVGRPQQMKTLNLKSVNCIFLTMNWVAGLYEKNAFVLTPKSVMQSAIYHETLNPLPPMTIVKDHDYAQIGKTYSSCEIRQVWNDQSWKNSFLGSDDKPFEEICFKQPQERALIDSGLFSL